MGLPTPGPSLRTGDRSRLLWSLCQLGQDLCLSLLLRVWCRRDPTSSQARHVSGVGRSSITEQWLCCGRKRPDRHSPARRRAPFPRQRGASSPACLLRQLYSIGQVLCPGPPCCLRVPVAARGCKRPSSACLQPRHCGDPTLCLVRARRPRAGGVAQRERLRLEGAPQPL